MEFKKAKVFAIASSCLLALTLATGCSDDFFDDEDDSGESQGLTITVNQKTGGISINRPESGTTLTGATTGSGSTDKNAWTIFVYLCGSDLESNYGAGTADLEEMASISDSEDVRFVVETGGAKDWQNGTVKAKKTQRLVVQNGDVTVIDSLDKQNMGESNTLADFLIWGTAEYPAEHQGVILWDHGGGSISGVCLDENFKDDALSLKELDAAFLSAYGKMDRKFDFIGFDACLMGTLETANILASYADYMYASEEMEPGSGWDYDSISAYLSEHPDADGAQLGKVVCDSFYESNTSSEDEEIVTLSVIDLSKMDDVVSSFNTLSRDLCNVAGDSSKLSAIVRGVNDADNYGGNNRSEGYTNMVDLLGIAQACESYIPSSSDMKSALKSAVTYSIAGSTHKNAGGLSVYYPLSVEDANELAVFEQVCVSPYYLTFVDTVERTSAQDAGDAIFDFSSWFDDDDTWEWESDYDYDDDTGWFNWDSDSLDEEYWSYENESDETGESPLISFYEEPGYDDEGYYSFTLSDDALDYATSVSAYVYEVWDDVTVELGETCDVYGDWDTGTFTDNFDGRWLSLPDGQNLATYVAETTDDYVVYTSPIKLNDEETNLRIRKYYDSDKVVIEGAWDGLDDNGMAAREIRKIVAGDVIVPQYYSADNESDDTDLDGNAFRVDGEFSLSFAPLQGYKYEYCFIIDDAYGDYYMTEPAIFEVDDYGEITSA